MPTTVSVEVDRLRGGRPVRLEAGERGVLVALVEGHVVAYEDACRHRGTSLAQGQVRRCIVTCPAHLWRYDLRTGHRHGTYGESLPRYAVSVADGMAVVELPDPPPQLSMRETLLAHAREHHPPDLP
jgi:nitrite reductase/ring-hydroxylating ferredoxin subunit